MKFDATFQSKHSKHLQSKTNRKTTFKQQQRHIFLPNLQSSTDLQLKVSVTERRKNERMKEEERRGLCLICETGENKITNLQLFEVTHLLLQSKVIELKSEKNTS
jgi:hypothetical protein